MSEVLTKGNHPRGIKVRLQTGQVGRVQRLGEATSTTQSNGPLPSTASTSTAAKFTHRYRDVREDLEYADEPPTRSLADFLPPSFGNGGSEEAMTHQESPATYEAVGCPICEAFEGDEAAVTHHIEREHLT